MSPILVVEDDAEVRHLITTVLGQRRYAILEARNGSEGLALVRQHAAIRLVLTDIVMPEMSGAELADGVRTIAPHVKVVFISGYSRGAAVDKVLDSPDRFFLQKPFSPANLARMRPVRPGRVMDLNTVPTPPSPPLRPRGRPPP